MDNPHEQDWQEEEAPRSCDFCGRDLGTDNYKALTTHDDMFICCLPCHEAAASEPWY